MCYKTDLCFLLHQIYVMIYIINVFNSCFFSFLDFDSFGTLKYKRLRQRTWQTWLDRTYSKKHSKIPLSSAAAATENKVSPIWIAYTNKKRISATLSTIFRNEQRETPKLMQRVNQNSNFQAYAKRFEMKNRQEKQEKKASRNRSQEIHLGGQHYWWHLRHLSAAYKMMTTMTKYGLSIDTAAQLRLQTADCRLEIADCSLANGKSQWVNHFWTFSLCLPRLGLPFMGCV